MRPIGSAVILAAGRGNRLSGTGPGVPKPLRSLDGTECGITFLDWHLWCLNRVGVERIFVVGNQATYGHRLQAMDGHQPQGACERDPRNSCAHTGPRPPETVDACWILNPTEDLSTSGSGHSAWIAWCDAVGILDGRSRTILMDADIVYEPDLLALLRDDPQAGSAILVCPHHAETMEEVLVYGRAVSSTVTPMPYLLGKGLPGTPLTVGLSCLGEATGITLWDPEDHAALRAVADWTMHFSTARQRSEHEDITGHMMRLGRVHAVMTPPGAEFLEVDTPQDYVRLTTAVYPRLAGRLARFPDNP